MYRVRELPKIERPRERLLEVGASNLSNEELLAIILKNGTTSKNVKQLSGEVLKEFGGVYELKNVTVERLKKIKGIDILEVAQRLGLPVTSYKKSIV